MDASLLLKLVSKLLANQLLTQLPQSLRLQTANTPRLDSVNQRVSDMAVNKVATVVCCENKSATYNRPRSW
jgi:hypothetical protein